MPFTILSDSDIRYLLTNLTTQDATQILEALGEALHEYSMGDTNSACCQAFQPERTILKKKGVTSLFMPASTGNSVGMKIVSLDTVEAPPSNSTNSHKSSISSATTAMDGLKLTPASTMSSVDTGRSSISGDSFRPPPSVASSQGSVPKGIVTLMDASGTPVGVLNALEMTAFRTSLAAMYAFLKRDKVHTITVFGAGKQAYWHIRLALLFRHKEIHHINIINRSFTRCAKLMKSFVAEESGHPEWQHVKFSAMTPEFGEYGRLLKKEIRDADVIFCTTPSTEPLFPHEFLTSHEGRRKGRYISAIGSYAPHMIEIHPDIIKQAVAPTDGHHHHHKHARTEGVVVVDTLDGCLKEAGEIIQAKVRPDQLVEIGELLMLKKANIKAMEEGKLQKKDLGLLEWLQKGNVIYKSVGLGLMDLVVGGEMVRLAREKEVGITIDDF